MLSAHNQCTDHVTYESFYLKRATFLSQRLHSAPWITLPIFFSSQAQPHCTPSSSLLYVSRYSQVFLLKPSLSAPQAALCSVSHTYKCFFSNPASLHPKQLSALCVTLLTSVSSQAQRHCTPSSSLFSALCHITHKCFFSSPASLHPKELSALCHVSHKCFFSNPASLHPKQLSALCSLLSALCYITHKCFFSSPASLHPRELSALCHVSHKCFFSNPASLHPKQLSVLCHVTHKFFFSHPASLHPK